MGSKRKVNQVFKIIRMEDYQVDQKQMVEMCTNIMQDYKFERKVKKNRADGEKSLKEAKVHIGLSATDEEEKKEKKKKRKRKRRKKEEEEKKKKKKKKKKKRKRRRKKE
jgi:hypothetical protein